MTSYIQQREATRATLALVTLLSLLAIEACSPKTEPKTVEYYTAHPAERDKVVAACRNNPGQLKDDPDCVNANDSAIQGWGKAKLPAVSFATSAASAASAR
jgi:hypothetical protein